MRRGQIFELAHGILVLIALSSSDDSGGSPEPSMSGSRKFCQRGSNSDVFFLFQKRGDPNRTKSGPSLVRQRNAIAGRLVMD